MAALQETLERLFDRRRLGSRFSLEGMQSLCRKLGHPEQNLSFIHVAGTNGKGSVCAMAASILKEAGFRTGLYTSPHLIRFHERFRLDGNEISDSELYPLLEQVLQQDSESTFFEISTAIALLWFQRNKADVVLWETGLGGRLDATNIVQPKVSVITHIGREHTHFLGSTLAEIAREKAGIIKPRTPVVTPLQNREILDVIHAQAHEKNAPLMVLQPDEIDQFPAPLEGRHQKWNTTLAVHAARLFAGSIPSRILLSGLRKTKWLGRFQIIQPRPPFPLILLDGAHNPPAVQQLVSELHFQFPAQKWTLIFGVLSDKDASSMLQELLSVVDTCLLTPVTNPRTARPRDLQSSIPRASCVSDLSEALCQASLLPNPILITGSLFLVGEALKILNFSHLPSHPNEVLLTHQTVI